MIGGPSAARRMAQRASRGLRALGVAAAFALSATALAVPGTFGGFVAAIGTTTNAASSASYFACGEYTGDSALTNSDRANAVLTWPLNESSGTTAADVSGHSRPGTATSTIVTSTTTPLACPRDAGGAYVANGSSTYVASGTVATTPNFSLEVWFQNATTTSTRTLIGYGGFTGNGVNRVYDRQLYLSSTRNLVFALNPSTVQILTSSTTYSDTSWHHVVVTVSSTSRTTM